MEEDSNQDLYFSNALFDSKLHPNSTPPTALLTKSKLNLGQEVEHS